MAENKTSKDTVEGETADTPENDTPSQNVTSSTEPTEKSVKAVSEDNTKNNNTNGKSTTQTQTTTDKIHQDQGTQKLSKNQMKKRKRMEYLAAKKAKRKLQDKEVKRIKAVEAGRDLEKERKEQMENEQKGEGHRKREKSWINKVEKSLNKFHVCIDCSFEEKMSPKEINSLARQIQYCYSANRKSQNPCTQISVTNLSKGGQTYEHLNKINGFPEQWATRAFTQTEQSVVDIYKKDESDEKKNKSSESDMKDKSKLVYLTSDSENTLDRLEDGKVYIIGGIVDRNRLKREAITRAETLNIATAKLPISDHLKLFSTKVLTCNHVFEILLKFRESGEDWKKTLIDVLPQRKDIKELGA